MYKIKFILFTLLIFFKTIVFALDVPTLTGPVIDQARFLSEPVTRAISNALIDLQQREGVQFQVLIINKLQDETLEGFSIKVVDDWKLGKKGDDRAALFLISVVDHKMRIEVARGLEGSLTDFKSRKILDQVKPLFKSGDNDNGVALGLALMAKTAGYELNFDKNVIRPRHSRHISSNFIIIILMIFIFFLQYVFPSSMRGPGGFSGGYGGGFGGGSGSSNAGSDWSGGGGGFAGGGSSGDW